MRLNRNRSIVAALALCAVLSQAACAPTTPHKLKVDLNKIAASLNAAAKINHELYTTGVYGPVGSPGAIAKRQKVATVIYDSNEVLIVALGVAHGITAANFPASKTQILALLGEAAQAVASAHLGTQAIDLALQAAATFINEAVILMSALTSADLRNIPAGAWPVLNHMEAS